MRIAQTPFDLQLSAQLTDGQAFCGTHVGFDCSGDLWVDDGGYGVLREYVTDALGATTHTELAHPDFTALAESFGNPATLSSPATPGPSVAVLPAVLKLFTPTHL